MERRRGLVWWCQPFTSFFSGGGGGNGSGNSSMDELCYYIIDLSHTHTQIGGAYFTLMGDRVALSWGVIIIRFEKKKDQRFQAHGDY